MIQKIKNLFKKNGLYSTNYVLLTFSVAFFFILLFCGKSLWVPASRVNNLYLRSVLLASSDGLSFISAQTGLDVFVPRIRDYFLAITALEKNTAWDTRYFNTRVAQSSQISSAIDVQKVSVHPDELQREISKTVLDTSSDSEKKQNTKNDESVIQTTYSSSNPLQLYMFGDSQVFSLGSGFSRLSGKNGPISVEFLAIHSSGFIRSDYYNWPKKLEDEFSTNHYDAAAIMLGMNDYQNFWNDEKQIVKTGTEAWKISYKERCKVILDITIASVAKVYWIQMPLVRTSKYAESLSYIEQIHDELASEYSPDILQRVSLREVLPGKNKEYLSSFEVAPGKMIQVMSEDGSHYTVEGGQLVTKGLFDLVCRDFLFSEVPVAHLP